MITTRRAHNINVLARNSIGGWLKHKVRSKQCLWLLKMTMRILREALRVELDKISPVDGGVREIKARI